MQYREDGRARRPPAGEGRQAVHRTGWRLAMAAAAAALVVLGGLAFGPALADSSSFSSTSGVLLGANDFSCQPSPAHPRPVVLVHGTFANMTEWQDLAPQLSGAGYCVFALNYGCQAVNNTVCATGPIEESAQQLSDFVD